LSRRKIVWGFLFLVVASGIVLNVPFVSGIGTIYIRADGSVYPSTAPIQRVGERELAFTGNTTSSLVILGDSLVVDGAGYTIQGPGPSLGPTFGITLSGRYNVTIRNIEVREFDYGIYLYHSINNHIAGNNVISTFSYGIDLENSSNNTISKNVLTANRWDSIMLSGSSNYNIVSRNNVTNNQMGIRVLGGYGNYLSGNYVVANDEGVWIGSHSALRNNSIADNKYNFGVDIDDPLFNSGVSAYINDIDETNTINGKPILYLVNQEDVIIDAQTHPAGIGYLALVNSTNMTVRNLKIANNNEQGILVAYVRNSLIQNVTVAGNLLGIFVQGSSSNHIFGNNATSNIGYGGMWITRSDNNTISGNIIRGNSPMGLWLSFALHNSIFSNNVTANNYNGIYLEGSRFNFVFSNIIAANGNGISLDGGSENRVFGNNLTENAAGVRRYRTLLNKIYHNNFVHNAIQVADETDYGYFYNDIWDFGYPFGGNFWNDYVVVDFYGGPYQNLTGSDGIGDSPYIINTYNRDNYPLTNPWTEDRNSPITTINVIGNLGDNDWFTSNVSVTLNAIDDTEVEKTEYSFDNATWTNYTTPLTLTTEGSIVVYFKSTDTIGNIEETNAKMIKIDKTIPIGSFSINNNVAYTNSTSVVLTLTAADVVSGVYQVRYSNDGVWDTEQWETPLATTSWTLTAGDGSKTVYYQIKDNAGLISSYSDSIILDTTNPTANAGVDQTVNEDTLVTLDASGSTDENGIATYAWTFTDVTPQTLTGVNPTYTFATLGTYTITLKVTDPADNWATDTVIITVTDITKPVANAGQDQTVNVGIAATFDASGSTDNVGIVSYEWNFGDGTTGTGKTTTHTYASADTYTVTLTVKDAAGNTATHQITITVKAPPAEGFPMWITGAAIAAIGIAVVVALLLRKRK